MGWIGRDCRQSDQYRKNFGPSGGGSLKKFEKTRIDRTSGSRIRWWADPKAYFATKSSYFHVVFTLPHLLNALIRQNPVELYNLLFRSVAETLMEVAANPKHLGAEIGFFAILHTWSQNILFPSHPLCRPIRRFGSRPHALDTWLRHIL